MAQKTKIIGSLVAFFGLLWLLTTTHPVFINNPAEVGSSGFNSSCELKAFTGCNVLKIRHNWNQPKLPVTPPVNECNFREKRRAFIDRTPTPSVLFVSGIFVGTFLHAKSLICHFTYVKYTSWSGNCTKIRPPPVS